MFLTDGEQSTFVYGEFVPGANAATSATAELAGHSVNKTGWDINNCVSCGTEFPKYYVAGRTT